MNIKTKAALLAAKELSIEISKLLVFIFFLFIFLACLVLYPLYTAATFFVGCIIFFIYLVFDLMYERHLKVLKSKEWHG